MPSPLTPLRCLAFAFIGLLGFIFSIGTQQKGPIEMAFSSPGPTADLKISRPHLFWEVWGKGANQVTETQMTLNGQPVPATYDPTSKTLSYQPQSPLAAGTYQVTARAVVEKLLSKDVSWSFTIGPEATPDPPPTTDTQNTELTLLNAIRAQASLPPLHLDLSLCAGAQGHAHYMAANRSITHIETQPGKAFLGRDPAARVGAYGFAGSIYESVAFGEGEPMSATIQSLFDAPYHRIGLLQPVTAAVGVGEEKGFITIDTAYAMNGDIVMNPNNGQTLASGSWEAIEEPNPLDLHSLKSGPRIFVGYPIVVASFNRDNHIRSGVGGLKGPQGEVDCVINEPSQDAHLVDGLFIIPRKPLAPGQYSAWAEVTFDNGNKKRLEWNFSVNN